LEIDRLRVHTQQSCSLGISRYGAHLASKRRPIEIVAEASQGQHDDAADHQLQKRYPQTRKTKEFYRESPERKPKHLRVRKALGDRDQDEVNTDGRDNGGEFDVMAAL